MVVKHIIRRVNNVTIRLYTSRITVEQQVNGVHHSFISTAKRAEQQGDMYQAYFEPADKTAKGDLTVLGGVVNFLGSDLDFTLPSSVEWRDGHTLTVTADVSHAQFLYLQQQKLREQAK